MKWPLGTRCCQEPGGAGEASLPFRGHVCGQGGRGPGMHSEGRVTWGAGGSKEDFTRGL